MNVNFEFFVISEIFDGVLFEMQCYCLGVTVELCALKDAKFKNFQNITGCYKCILERRMA